jgi:transcriptional regulator of heat shock response
MVEDLTPRQQLILGLVVREYIAAATPVASKTLEGIGTRATATSSNG